MVILLLVVVIYFVHWTGFSIMYDVNHRVPEVCPRMTKPWSAISFFCFDCCNFATSGILRELLAFCSEYLNLPLVPSKNNTNLINIFRGYLHMKMPGACLLSNLTCKLYIPISYFILITNYYIRRYRKTSMMGMTLLMRIIMYVSASFMMLNSSLWRKNDGFKFEWKIQLLLELLKQIFW